MYNWVGPTTLVLQTAGNGDIDYWDVIAFGSSSEIILHEDPFIGGPGTEAWDNGVTATPVPGDEGIWGRPVQVTPEPATLALFGTGALALLGVAVLGDRRRRALV